MKHLVILFFPLGLLAGPMVSPKPPVNHLLNPTLLRAAERKRMKAPEIVVSREQLADGRTVTVFTDGVVRTNLLPRMFTQRVELTPQARILKAAMEMASAQGADPDNAVDIAEKLTATKELVMQLTSEIRKSAPDMSLVETLVRDLDAVALKPDKPIIVAPVKGTGR